MPAKNGDVENKLWSLNSFKKVTKVSDPKNLMPSDHTTKTYHFKMRYKTLIPNREESGNEFPP